MDIVILERFVSGSPLSIFCILFSPDLILEHRQEKGRLPQHPQLAAKMAFDDVTNNQCLKQMEDVCANCNVSACGAAADDSAVVLKNCAACLLVKYCSADCQRAHRKQHKKACKKRVAKLKDERLYRHGHERPERDFCPI